MSDLSFFNHYKHDINIKKPKYLVIFLHGYGANGANLIELANYYEKSIPDAYFIAPNALEPFEGGFPDCYQWFSLLSWGQERDVTKISGQIISANNKLRDFIYKKLKDYDLALKDLILIGFSQGAMMASYQALTFPEKISGIISYSGKLILPNLVGEKIITKPKMCFVHGKKDSVLGFDNFIEAQELAKNCGLDYESHAIENLDHSIDHQALKAGINFVEKNTN